MIHVRSACKINLTLDVLRLRADGYHELDSIVHTVALWDEIALVPNEIGFVCNVDLPEENLCTKAAARWFAAINGVQSFSTVLIRLKKNLPIGAGIGGGSGNAAAVLLALNALQKQKKAPVLDDAKLHEIAAKLGADVPLFLRGGCQRMQGIGEKISHLPTQNLGIVILKPPVFGDTRAVFARWDATQTASHRATETLLPALQARDFQNIARDLGNDLEEAARQSGQPVDETLKLLHENGARGVCLSGSGAACFGVFETIESARECEKRLRNKLAPDWFLAVAALCERGVETVA